MQHPKRIVVIGPESTGKSTLSQQLAAALHTVWVPEYARTYLEQIERPYVEDDLAIIAQGQLHSEDEQAQKANKYLIIDTDLNVIKVWSEHKYGRCTPDISKAIAERHYELYLLTGIDIPWQHDPLREHPAPEERAYFYQLYHNIVATSGIPWAAIDGTETERLATALKAITLAFPQSDD